MVKIDRGAKRGRSDDDDDEQPSRGGAVASIGEATSGIKNKLARGDVYQKLKSKKQVPILAWVSPPMLACSLNSSSLMQKVKRVERNKRQKAYEEAEREGLEPPPKAIPKTVENTRAKDETMVTGPDEEVEADEADDEFAAHFSNERPPNVLITTCYRPSKISESSLQPL